MSISPKNEIIDSRKINLRRLAERLNLPIVPAVVEPSAQERLRLGKLGYITGLEHTGFGAFIHRKVTLYNSLPANLRREGAKAPSFEGFAALSRGKHDATFQDYCQYLSWLDPQLASVIADELERPLYVEETRDRRKHTLVVGAPGAGKSELMKLMVYHYVKHHELGGVLVIDPHAKMAQQIARWKEFTGAGADRLVYLDPVKGKSNGGWVPALNPITKGNATEDETSTVAKQLANALTYFGGQNEGMTDQMHRLAAYCLSVMLDMEGATLLDLMEGLTTPARGKDAPKTAEAAFVTRGKSHPNKVVRDFFLNDWGGESYRVTRDALKRRLTNYLDVPLFQRVVTASDPLNLEALLNAGKVVVVNCSFAGEAGKALGRFLMAQIESIGQRRLDSDLETPYPPIHVFVDEATILVSPPFVRILQEFRKVRIWLTMGQQGMGEGGERAFLHKVKNSAHLKFIGRSGSTGEVLRAVGVKTDPPRLGEGEFVVIKNGEESMPMLLRTLHPSPLKDDDNAMSAAEWAAVLEGQFAAYYRQPPKPLTSPTPSPQGGKRGRRGDEWGDG